MGGGSALLINSNRRGGNQTDFGCQGWFCDVLNAAMSILVLMIIGTAFFGCYRSCCKKKKISTPRPASVPKSPRRQDSEDPEATSGALGAPVENSENVRITVDADEGKRPPDYCENDNLPPPYSDLRFDQPDCREV